MASLLHIRQENVIWGENVEPAGPPIRGKFATRTQKNHVMAHCNLSNSHFQHWGSLFLSRLSVAVENLNVFVEQLCCGRNKVAA
jgi:hypothetical protein